MLFLGCAVLLVLIYTVYSYNNLQGKSYIHEPLFLSIRGKLPDYAKIVILYKTINDPTKSERATQIIQDTIPENMIIFEIDSSYRVAEFSIYFQLLRENDEIILDQIKFTNTKCNEFNFSLKPRDLVATNNLKLIPINNSVIKIRKITKNDPHGAALHFNTRGSLGGIFLKSELRIPERPSIVAILACLVLGMLLAYIIFPVISRIEWKGISAGAFLLAATILILPSGEKICNLLLAMAILAGLACGIREGKVLDRFRKNRSILIPIIIITAIYLTALFKLNGNTDSLNVLKIKFGLPMTLMAVALNTNSEKELRLQFVALLTGVIISVFIHFGWALTFLDVVEVRSKFFLLPRYYLESTVFSRVHHSYLSIIYLFSLTTLYYLKDYLALRIKDIFIISLLIILGLLFAFARVAILSLVIIIIYFIIRKTLNHFGIELRLASRIIASVLLATTLLLMVFSDLNNFSNNAQIKGLDTRMGIWHTASDLVKQKPLFGWGPGAYKDALDLGNLSASFNTNTYSNLNTHNQFLETSGMFGLLTTMALICFLLFPAGSPKKTAMYSDLILTIAIIFIGAFFFESILKRNLGILIFGISYGLLIKIITNSAPINKIK